MNHDDNAWEEFIKDIEKISSDKTVIQTKNIKLKVTPKITPNKIYNGASLSDLSIGDFNNIDKNTAQKFRKGELRIEAEIDLHGYTEDRAYEKVLGFIKNSYLKKRRCIAIITGKGHHPNHEDTIFMSRGVLKDLVPQWLNLPEIRPMILAISHPKGSEGGSGVIKILLRRQRD